MNQNFFVLVLCLLLLAGTSLCKAAKDEGYVRSPDWSQTNSMAHWPRDTIDIDDQQGDSFDEGSSTDDWAASGYPDDDDYDDERVDDERDEDIGSGIPPTRCQMLRERISGDLLIGAYIPRCTETGEFEPQQCSDTTGECWCVDFNGRTIPGTKRRYSSQTDCSNPGRDYTHRDPSGTRPGANPGGSDDSDEDFFEQPDPKNGQDRPDQNVFDVPKTTKEPSEAGPGEKVRGAPTKPLSLIMQPGILAGIIGGAVVGLLCTVLLMMFIVYRMRKKDEGSYVLDDPKQKARDREFFA